MSKAKEVFFNEVSEVLKKVLDELENTDLEKCKTREERLENRETQYKNVVYWYHVSFSDEILKKLNKNYISVSGFNIMPYRITKKDVTDAVIKGDPKTKPFNKAVLDKSDLIDFDNGSSANFHKKPDEERLSYQIVLTEGTLGPGWLGGKPIKNEIGWDERRKKIKENYYFPRIDSDKEKVDSKEELETIIKEVFKEIGLELPK